MKRPRPSSPHARADAGGFYSLPEGMKDIGYMGNQPSVGPYPGPTKEALAHLNAALTKLNSSRSNAAPDGAPRCCGRRHGFRYCHDPGSPAAVQRHAVHQVPTLPCTVAPISAVSSCTSTPFNIAVMRAGLTTVSPAKRGARNTMSQHCHYARRARRIHQRRKLAVDAARRAVGIGVGLMGVQDLDFIKTHGKDAAIAAALRIDRRIGLDRRLPFQMDLHIAVRTPRCAGNYRRARRR